MTYLLNHNFRNLKYETTTHTSAQVTSSSAETFITILGSECDSYRPEGDNVIYNFLFSAYKSGVTVAAITLEYADVGSASYAEVDSLNRRNIGNAGIAGQFNRWSLRYSWVIPAWSGQKKFRVRIGHQSANQEINLHGLDVWDGAGTTTEFATSAYYIYSV